MQITEKFKFCPVCGSSHFETNSEKSIKCDNCGFEYFVNPASSNVALILDGNGRLLVERRLREPAKGTLDLPGGFADAEETAEEGVVREVKEETELHVTSAKYLFSLPNTYRYSGIDIPTLDLFFLCEVEDTSKLKAGDDAAECFWIDIDDIHTELFGLSSVRHGLSMFIEQMKNGQQPAQDGAVDNI